MHEIVKSRSSTPLCEHVKPGVTETLQLLQKWNLPELQNTFKEHDITLRSLIHLTDEEICELVPKIGLRTIFRAMLKEWRQTYDAIAYPRISNSSLCEIDSDSYLDQIELKAECNTDLDIENNATGSRLECFKQRREKEHNFDTNNNEAQFVAQAGISPNSSKQSDHAGKSFIVLDILNGCSDGQTVLEFYRIHNFLDTKNRKRIVNLLIRHVVESKVEKYTAIFHDMTRQLLYLFPSEKYETYFVPHNGSHSARGALYYRYSNYTRQLRKEGLLAYKKHKPKNCNHLRK